MSEPGRRSSVTEVLVYALKAGCTVEFHAIMRDESIPLQRELGIEVVHAGPSVHDDQTYGLIRAFPSAQAMEEILANFYASAAWRLGPREKIVSLIEHSSRWVYASAAGDAHSPAMS